MIRRRLIGAAVVLVTLGAVYSAFGAPAGATRQTNPVTYSVHDLGALEAYSVTSAYAVNNQGIAVGQGVDPATFQGRAIVYQNGEIRAIGEGEKTSSTANDVNDAGQIVGYTSEQGSPSVAMLWHDDEATDLGTFGGDQSIATAINDKGQIVGAAALEPGSFEQHAFVWFDDEMLDLGTLPGGTTSIALGINAEGAVVGSSTIGAPSETGQAAGHAVLWQDGEVIDLGVVGGTFSQATDVNGTGLIVGFSTTGDGQHSYGPGTHAVLWREGRITDLGTLGEGEISSAEAINASGVVVGSSTVVGGEPSGQPSESHAFIWQADRLTDLNDLIPAAQGWVLEYAYDVSDNGAIVGTGMLDGELRAFILTPNEA